MAREADTTVLEEMVVADMAAEEAERRVAGALAAVAWEAAETEKAA